MKFIVKVNTYVLVLLLCVSWELSAQQAERPFIWINNSEKPAILEKIEKQAWAGNIYTDFIDQLAQDIRVHQTDPMRFLQALPFDWENREPNQFPPFHLTYHIENGNHKNLDNATDGEMANARKRSEEHTA